jgi:hypothetical protein
MSNQLTDTVLMIEPRYFAYNDQTAVTNHFQHEQQAVQDDWQSAHVEFWQMVKTLEAKGVEVIVEASKTAAGKDQETPDAVFPNWLTTYPDGRYCVHPLQTESRRRELQEDSVAKLMDYRGYCMDQAKRYEIPAVHTTKNQFVEGSGSAVINRVEGFVYAGLSARTDPEAIRTYSEWLGFPYLTFNSWFREDPLYHTDLMINIGDDFFIWCPEVIVSEDRKKVADSIPDRFEVIEISLDQMACFCANIRQLKTRSGCKVIAMSSFSFKAFAPGQLKRLEQYGEIVPIEIPTIERVGGGSVCCMICEIFLPKK